MQNSLIQANMIISDICTFTREIGYITCDTTMYIFYIN